MRRAYSYLRVSGKGQIDGDGFPRQREAILAFAEKSGIRIVREFRDEGVSGTKELDYRDGLSDLFAAIDNDGVRIVLVENASRLARDLLIQETIIQQLLAKGVTVLTADGLDMSVVDDPTRVLVRQIFGAIYQFEKAMLVIKLRGARERMKRKGVRCEGQIPYGKDESEKSVLTTILGLRRDGMRLSDIAEHLNAEGVPSRHGGQWNKGTLSKILRRLDRSKKKELA